MTHEIKKIELELFAPQIFKIVKKTFNRKFDPPTHNVENVVSYLDGCEIFGVFEKDELIGYLGFKMQNNTVELKSIAVLPNFQSTGIGKAMMTKLKSEIGQKTTWLVVHPQNIGAISSYLKSGFIPSGWKEDFFGDGQPRLIMECN